MSSDVTHDHTGAIDAGGPPAELLLPAPDTVSLPVPSPAAGTSEAIDAGSPPSELLTAMDPDPASG